MMKQSEAILDIGSLKVVCMIGDCSAEGRFEVYGIGICEHKGLRKGIFIDEAQLASAIKTAVNTAQAEARRKIRKVYVGVPGPFIRLFCRQGELNFAASRAILESDIDEIVDASLIDSVPPENATHIHGTPISFKTDGKYRSGYPIGASTKTLWAAVSHVYMDNEFKTLISGMLDEIGLHCETFICTAYAVGMLLIPEKRRQEDSIVLDVGYYHTELCIIRNGSAIVHAVLPVGGFHLASDISVVKNISTDIAEAIKRRHVFGLDYSSRTDSYRLIDGRIEDCEYSQIQDIIESRAEEMALMIQSALVESPVDLDADMPVYLCGGGLSMMRGCREFLQSHLGRPIYTEMPWLPRFNSPNYVSAYSILNYVCNSGLTSNGFLTDIKENKLFKSLMDFFTK